MIPEPSQTAQDIFADAVELSGEERRAFVDRVCGADAALRAKVEQMLADYSAATFLDKPRTPALPRTGHFEPGYVLAGRFRIVRYIDSGGMGDVYEAEDTELGERIAIKTIRADIAANAATIERFKREIHLSRRVTHENVCRIFDLERHSTEQGDVTFLTMELLAGETLSARIRRAGRMSCADAMPIARQMAAALEAAHRVSIVHRDFKSGNVMLVPRTNGSIRVVVTDLGLARGMATPGPSTATMTAPGKIAGTPAYMSPEQVQGGAITAATDIYALGVVLFETTTGAYPFTGNDAWETATKRLHQDAPSPRTLVPSIEPRWDKAILRCLERLPERRFHSAEDVARFLDGHRVKLARRAWRTPVVAIAALIGVAIGGVQIGRMLRSNGIASRKAVAVFEFKNASQRPESAWVGTDLAEGVRAQLAATGSLRTVSGEEVAEMKRDLAIPDYDSLGKTTLARVHRSGVDLVILGSYRDFGREGGGRIHATIQVQDAASGDTIDSVAADGTEMEIAALIGDIGTRLRARLGLRALSPEKEREIAASQPSARAAASYSEGLASLRGFDPIRARASLQNAIAIDPDFPFAHTALAETWSILGYDARAVDEARRAYELSKRLSLEDRLFIEGQYRSLTSDWNAAIDTYAQLFRHLPDDLEYGLRLARAQRSGGHGREAQATLAALRKLPQRQAEDPRIDLEDAEGSAALGNFVEAQRAAELAIRKARLRGARFLESRALNWNCATLRHFGQYVPAKAACESARQITTALDDKLGAARAVNGLGNIAYYERNDTAEALRMFEAAYESASSISAKRDMSGALNNIGMCHAAEGRIAKARQSYEEALALQREIGFQGEIPRTLGNIGELMLQQGSVEEAQRTFEEAIQQARNIGAQSILAVNLTNLGGVLLERGFAAVAGKAFEEALEINLRLRAKPDAANVLDHIGDLAAARGLPSVAQQKYREALAVQSESGDKTSAALSNLGLASLSVESGELAQAEPAVTSAIAEFAKAGDRESEVAGRLLLARILAGQSNLKAAQGEVQKAQQLATALGEKPLAIMAGIAGAELDARSQDRATRGRAVAELKRIVDDCQRSGMVKHGLEARLALLAAESGSRASPAMRRYQEDVAKRAEAAGLNQIADKARRI